MRKNNRINDEYILCIIEMKAPKQNRSAEKKLIKKPISCFFSLRGWIDKQVCLMWFLFSTITLYALQFFSIKTRVRGHFITVISEQCQIHPIASRLDTSHSLSLPLSSSQRNHTGNQTAKMCHWCSEFSNEQYCDTLHIIFFLFSFLLPKRMCKCVRLCCACIKWALWRQYVHQKFTFHKPHNIALNSAHSSIRITLFAAAAGILYKRLD